MRKVPTNLLRPGLKVGRAVYNASGQVLLQAGTILTERFITRLKMLGIPAVYIDDFPGVEVEDVISEETRAQAIAKVKALLLSKSQQSTGPSRALIGVKDMISTVNEIIDELLSRRSLMVNLVDIRSLDEYTFGHSVNVCVLAIITGITLGYSRTKLFHLGMAALLHDIGKTRIPLEILNKPGPLTGEEFQLIKKHCIYGAEILEQDPGANLLCRIVAMQHHERHNGQGYPLGLKGAEIHEFAQITGLVDMYDALTADRVYRPAYPVHEAYEMIAGSGDYLFDFDIVQAFLSNVAAYPAGSLVRLSSGEIGVVIETERGFSLYPRVLVLFSAHRQPLAKPYEIKLAEHRHLTVTEVIKDYWEAFLETIKNVT
ncbi:HD-GYP domain-containing protein [Desulfofundulus thermosubterraneus]|uniref:HD domain-containing protein n=1 Tax=Desulfofundulus thermosubterraneus DSM 16057 TaxID=1121432 RepID=A0A1M6K6H8_9FIRM|nr:HD domain-containing phosphohydrolase [Desulfofundulus thermosubterraneus]SHJ54517.1 HD domain-containing protein [Desulfofundulus thermosubterraneus DSM 16057]